MGDHDDRNNADVVVFPVQGQDKDVVIEEEEEEECETMEGKRDTQSQRQRRRRREGGFGSGFLGSVLLSPPRPLSSLGGSPPGIGCGLSRCRFHCQAAAAAASGCGGGCWDEKLTSK